MMSTTIITGTTMAAICPPSNLPTLASTFPPPVALEVGFVTPEVGFVAPEVGFVAPEVGILVPPAKYGERESNAHVCIALWIHIVHCVPLALYPGSFTRGKRK